MSAAALNKKVNQDKRRAQVDDDDQSTAVPSDVLDGTESAFSTWDTGNIEELGSCGVLTSAEMRAARLQRLGRSSGAAQAKATVPSQKPKARTQYLPAASSGGYANSAPAQLARPKAAAASSTPKPTMQVSATVGSKPEVDDDDQSTVAPSDVSSGGLTSVALRAARLAEVQVARKPQQPIKPQPVVSQVAKPSPQKAHTQPLPAPSQSQAVARANAGTQVKSELDKLSREAIRDMGLWEYMPARNPIVTRQTVKGSDWHVGFDEYEHSLGGVPDARPVERPQRADEMMRNLDMQSREAIKEMGLWEHMPAKNPVVTKQTNKGADWNIGFEEYVHTLGGVPDSQPIERPHKADELTRRLDVISREKIKEMGLWEHMPARNPVVTQQTNKGAGWHVGFGEYVHTLGGVPSALK